MLLFRKIIFGTMDSHEYLVETGTERKRNLLGDAAVLEFDRKCRSTGTAHGNPLNEIMTHNFPVP
jgi:hypothetical protein